MFRKENKEYVSCLLFDYDRAVEEFSEIAIEKWLCRYAKCGKGMSLYSFIKNTSKRITKASYVKRGGEEDEDYEEKTRHDKDPYVGQYRIDSAYDYAMYVKHKVDKNSPRV